MIFAAYMWLLPASIRRFAVLLGIIHGAEENRFFTGNLVYSLNSVVTDCGAQAKTAGQRSERVYEDHYFPGEENECGYGQL